MMVQTNSARLHFLIDTSQHMPQLVQVNKTNLSTNKSKENYLIQVHLHTPQLEDGGKTKNLDILLKIFLLFPSQRVYEFVKRKTEVVISENILIYH